MNATYNQWSGQSQLNKYRLCPPPWHNKGSLHKIFIGWLKVTREQNDAIRRVTLGKPPCYYMGNKIFPSSVLKFSQVKFPKSRFKNFPNEKFFHFLFSKTWAPRFSQIRNSKFSHMKFSQVKFSQLSTRFTEMVLCMSSQRLPNKSFPKYKFQNFANVPNKLPAGTFWTNIPNMAHKTFPNCFGKEYSQLIFPTKFFQTSFHSFTKKFQNFPITNKFSHLHFQTFPKSQSKGVEGFPI